MFQSVLSSDLSDCKAILHYSFLFLEKYSIFLCVSHVLLACFQVSSKTTVMENMWRRVGSSDPRTSCPVGANGPSLRKEEVDANSTCRRHWTWKRRGEICAPLAAERGCRAGSGL